ncbi:hypothetical protein AB0C68_38695 [Streptomyces tendae]|uniref:hypothetical protein n=1 Tax=Streptomyces tendae TaxID=1932 RepID=UPI0033F6DC5D
MRQRPGYPPGGEKALTGIFPCSYTGCGLVRLRHTADLSLLYDDQYGYRSGIRPFMINHLHSKVDELTKLVDITPDDLILDIGSNDGTLLSGYPADGHTLVGVDPTRPARNGGSSTPNTST